MVNQDPQPEYWTTVHDFPFNAGANTTNIATIFTNQASNEEVRIYGFGVDVVPLGTGDTNLSVETVTNPYFYDYEGGGVGPPFGTFTDFNVEIFVGGNQIPTNDIEMQRFLMPGANPQPYITFSSPVLVLYQQPLQIQLTNNDNISAHTMVAAGTAVNTVRVKVTLIAETEIQKRVA